MRHSASATKAAKGRLTVLMFSNDGGEITEKHTRNTSVCGYDRGRRRLYVSLALHSSEMVQARTACAV